MITKTAATLQCPNGWQAELANAIRDPAQLLAQLHLPGDLLDAATRAAQQFPLRVPLSFVRRMRLADPDDPLLRQVLPLGAELAHVPGYHRDPVGDLAALASPGLIHKYHGRALLVTTGACAVHCRYCFRRHFPYPEHAPNPQHWRATLDYLTEHAQISEIILSGGDPLSLSDKRLAELVMQLDAVPQLSTLRIHTRLPVVLPNRISPALLTTLSGTRLHVVMVLHINHPNELDESLKSAIADLRKLGIHCLNQSVLLRGINDCAATLIDLSRGLFAAGVLPYYLHQLDPVAGAHHFAVPLAEGQRIMAEVRAQLPGYLVPRYAQELAGADAKRAIPY
jgi:EF-P beta-lysylation protein EpmB